MDGEVEEEEDEEDMAGLRQRVWVGCGSRSTDVARSNTLKNPVRYKTTTGKETQREDLPLDEGTCTLPLGLMAGVMSRGPSVRKASSAPTPETHVPRHLNHPTRQP